QKQRIAIAGVLAIRPDVLVLDEATAMLDPIGRKAVLDIAQSMNKQLGITVVMITQYMDEAVLADRVVVMNGGRIAMEGTPQEIFRRGEELREMRLDVPVMVELRDKLTAAGLMPESNALTVDGMAEELCPLLLKI
ncbi:MAG: energy-coupling factor transporter ATPase, partial [Clostridia bacterium]|nr:energy-coupling factor transporter ATPase [Clostridia bacterium]